MNRRPRPMAWLVAILSLATAATASEDRGFSGILVTPRDGWLEVRTLRPGPVDGGLVTSSSLRRGDRIIALDGGPATPERWEAAHARGVGSEVRIEYRRDGDADEAAPREVVVTLDDPTLWNGSWSTADLPPRPLSEATADAAIGRALDALGPMARERADRLAAHLAAVPEANRDPRTAPLLRQVMAEPGAAGAIVESTLPDEALWTDSPFRAAATLVARAWTDDPESLPPAHGSFAIEHADAGIWYLDFLLNEARVAFESSVAPDAVEGDLRALVVERLDDLMVRGPRSRAAMTALAGIDRFTPRDAARIIAHFDVVASPSEGFLDAEPVELPPALVGAVEGEILAASEIPELGWLVVGGRGDNRYDLGRVAAVLDVAGDDRYDWNQGVGAHRLVVDLAGDDLHRGGGIAGPAGALGAVSIIDDRAGNDRYEGGALTAGAALGVSVLLDRRGDDLYDAGAWSLGASAGGAALVVDLEGNDRASCEGMGMGVGGPLGVGAFVDRLGDDWAELGRRPSVYGVDGEHAGFGMGLGLGFRLASAGGVGYFIDLAGSDIRRSGEFSQGCGYFLGLGVLVDGAGDDTAMCDRYGLGSAAHQAAGVAIDRAGRDTYVARTAAHLGGSWDESLGFFHDGGGDDAYRVDVLSLGGAAQQAMAIFIDRSGDDAYRAGGATLGASSGNDYHFSTTGLGSLGLFLDLAGRDLYPVGRTDGTVRPSAEAPGEGLREQDGVFLDEPVEPRP